ncbi:hypothetical protein SELMODRAFT_445517 [Selaginella moellendorffii]|uniref:isoleucine--tRNA ligase n=1 Tax=Selaginella moellendorffii TaxID=88036 RepID=D8SJ90_SELML|nr:hypothetical protein SELMODRAFT_445517 [Selaginella moellendorffii]
MLSRIFVTGGIMLLAIAIATDGAAVDSSPPPPSSCDTARAIEALQDCRAAVDAKTGTGKPSAACCEELKKVGKICLCAIIKEPPRGVEIEKMRKGFVLSVSCEALGVPAFFFSRGLRERSSGAMLGLHSFPRSPVLAAAKNAGKQPDSRYKGTIELPQTKFSLKANSVTREPEIQRFWEQKQLLETITQKNQGEPFTLHDGPPYANGDLHMGHALNKILKDFINRYQLLQGRKIFYVPGWDCHGLPIELKVLQSIDAEARMKLSPIELRKKAAEFALKTVDQQRSSFQRYGVWGSWNSPYLTLQPAYEAAQIGVFCQMVLNGYIYRGRKPVHWSPSSGTALAEAELEYPEGHTSRSMYAVFKMTFTSDKFPKELEYLLSSLGVAIWTTTPWTVPGNTGVAVNEKLTYSVVEVVLNNDDSSLGGKKSTKAGRKYGNGLLKPVVSHLIVAADLVSSLEDKWNVQLVVKGSCTGSALEFCRYKHPLENREGVIVIGGDYITTDSGTGLVHTAPGHGQEDFVTGQKYGLPMLSPVDDNGNFTDEANEFAGMSVLSDGNEAVIKALDANSSLLMEEAYGKNNLQMFPRIDSRIVHKYPYDWRTKKPTIFRATEQWFASVEGFMPLALAAIKNVDWIPSQGENRITSMVSGRKEWCISRQRAWGVPIPVFYHVDTGEPLLNEQTISHVQAIIAQQGSDAWWSMTTEDLLPDTYKAKASNYRKGTDTMDVWFDSGTSWASVLGTKRWPADVYLEGSDQHRGWFQSSLLTSVATRGVAPYRQVLTHGFVLDEKNVKMSKSLGNVVDPRSVIEGGKNQKEQPAYGADVLRLWVASVDYTGDVAIGPQILKQTADVYRKLRGTLRYLLSNLHDWKPELEIEYDDLPGIDKYTLFQLASVMDSLKDSLDKYQFGKFFQSVQRYAVLDLSNFYLDISKDRLYVGGTDSFTRRSCQTVLASLLLYLARGISPVVPHLAEDAWQHLPFSYILPDGSKAESVFEAGWPEVDPRWRTISDRDKKLWSLLLELRVEVNKVLESARMGKLIGANLDAKVCLHLGGEDDALLHSTLQAMAGSEDGTVDKLHVIFLTSQVEVVDCEDADCAYTGSCKLEGSGGRAWIGVKRAEGQKCERCWKYSPAVGSFTLHSTLCERCYKIVEALQSPVLATS